MIDGALCFFSLSLKSKRRKTTTQHEEFVRDEVRGGFLIFGFDEGAGRRKKDWARQLQLQLSLLLLLFLLLLF
jgi:hypothetical protein